MKQMSYISMPYIIIVLAIIILLTLFLTCCTDVFQRTKTEPHRITGMMIYKSHMEQNQNYSFYIREEDEAVLLDAEFFIDEEPYLIRLENCQVSENNMDILLELEDEFNIGEYVQSFRKKPSIFQVSDETYERTTLYFDDGSSKTADTSSEYEQALYGFFRELAVEYKSQSVES